MTVLLGILICAALFGAFAAARPRTCNGRCPGCGTACDRYDGEGEHR